MKVSIDVKMKAEYIYDMLLHHMYSRLTGFLINLTGLTIIMIGGLSLRSGKLSLMQALGYVLVGIVVLVYTPVSLKRKANKIMSEAKYQSVIQYEFNEEGIAEQLAGQTSIYPWDQIEKAVATPKDIVFYLNDSKALVMPKEHFQDNFMPVMKLIVANMTREQVYIR